MMEVMIRIAGEELDSRSAAKQLHQIADLIKAGVTVVSGESIGYMGEFDMSVDFEAEEREHRDYWDGEHNHIHVDDEGLVVFRRGPDKDDGSDDLEQLHDQRIKLADWAAQHGGITPFDTEEEEDGHEH